VPVSDQTARGIPRTAGIEAEFGVDGTPAFDDPLRQRLGWLGNRLPSTNAPIRPELVGRILLRVSVLRTLYYSARFRGRFLVARGTRIVLDRSARVEFGPKGFLLIGFHHDSPLPALLNMGRQTRMIVPGTVQVWRGSQIHVLRGGCLEFSDKNIFNEGSRITCCESVRWGSGSGLSWDASLLDTDLHPIHIDGEWRKEQAPVVIGDHVVVGTRALVLKGITIGSGAIIAAGAVVTSDVPAHSLVGGNPARVIREGVDWR
jgi:tetrahydrodipicolinate N-acetyltransferase